MTKQQFDLFIQLALVVYRMAPPDDQRIIERLMDEMEAAEQVAAVAGEEQVRSPVIRASEHLSSERRRHAPAIKLIEQLRDEYIGEHCQSYPDGHYVSTPSQNEYIGYLEDIIQLLRTDGKASPQRPIQYLTPKASSPND